jgi:hypothetical protein
MIFLKVHHSCRNVVAACDAELIGKKFEEGKRQLYVRENFYKDRELSKEEAIKLMQMQAKEDSTFNIVGEEAISAAVEAGVLSKESIAKIKNIPFALILV